LSHQNPAVEAHIASLFGTDEYRAANTMRGEKRLRFLHDIYKEQLQTIGRFTYLSSFRMLNAQGKTPSWLFYGTRRIEGLVKMKDAMWSVDRGGGVQFSDRLAGQEVLFARDQLDVGPLRQALLDRFVGQTVPVSTVEMFVLTETPYSASHYKNRVLKPLEMEGRIEVEAPSGRRRGTFPSGTQIRFSPS
jgi:hypothetical protein